MGAGRFLKPGGSSLKEGALHKGTRVGQKALKGEAILSEKERQAREKEQPGGLSLGGGRLY